MPSSLSREAASEPLTRARVAEGVFGGDRRDHRCTTCGYGAVFASLPDRCPMCGGRSWRLAEPTAVGDRSRRHAPARLVD